MIFLPVVERELRVASRKRSTFWIRIIAALVALLIATGFLILSAVGSFAFATTALGKVLFGVLTWLSLAAALSAGLFFTSDCLSEEKREGTLGFLFLTDCAVMMWCWENYWPRRCEAFLLSSPCCRFSPSPC